MKKTPIISIMIPVYNTSQYLERCINTVINQTITNIEIILIDDGSTDGSGQICDKYAKNDSRIKVIHKSNGGLASARIAGIENARGEWLGFVDSDDWIDSNMYQELYETVLGQIDIDVAIGGYVEEKDEHTVHVFDSGNKRIMEPCEALLDMFESRDYNWSLCDKLYRHSLFDKYMVKSWPRGYGEDTYINWHVFNKCRKISYFPIMGYHYYMNSESMMHKRFSKEKFDYCRIYDHILREIDIEKSDNKKIAERIMNIALNACMPIIYYAQEEYDLNKTEIEKAVEQMRSYISYFDKCFGIKKFNVYNEMFQFIDRGGETIKEEKKQRDAKIIEFADGKQVFLYGAGKIAEDVMFLLRRLNIEVSYVVVSENNGKKTNFSGKEIIGLKELLDNNTVARVVLAMNKNNTMEVLKSLERYSYIKTFNAGKYNIYY